MAISVLVASLAGAIAGFVAGALSRQPEINELKKQVKSLQKEVERLQNIIEIQNSQIKELKIRYTALKGWQFLERNRQRGYIKGSLMYGYALKEYLWMLIEANENNKVDLNTIEIEFYNAFGTIINKGEITSKTRKVVIDYVKEKYNTEIDRFIEPDFCTIIDYLE